MTPFKNLQIINCKKSAILLSFGVIRY